MRCSLEKWRFRSEVFKYQELLFCSVLTCKSQRSGHLLALLELCLHSAALPKGPCWLTLPLEFCFVVCHRRCCQAAKASPTERFPKPHRTLKIETEETIYSLSFLLAEFHVQFVQLTVYSPPVVKWLAVLFIRKHYSMFYPKFPLLLFMLTAVFPSPVRDGEKLLYILILYLEHITETNYQLIFQPSF